MNKLKGCFMHETDHWKTPKEMYMKYINNGYIDPCPYKADYDGLKINYYNSKLYCNPPYSDIMTWVNYLLKQYDENNCDFHLLVPARTDTKWFHKLLERKNLKIEFIKGRLHFNDSKNSAPFPSLIIKLEHKWD